MLSVSGRVKVNSLSGLFRPNKSPAEFKAKNARKADTPKAAASTSRAFVQRPNPLKGPS